MDISQTLNKAASYGTACGPLEHRVKYYQGDGGYDINGNLVWTVADGPIKEELSLASLKDAVVSLKSETQETSGADIQLSKKVDELNQKLAVLDEKLKEVDAKSAELDEKLNVVETEVPEVPEVPETPTTTVIGKVEPPPEAPPVNDEMPDLESMTKASMQQLALKKGGVEIPKTKSHAHHVEVLTGLFT